MNETKRARFKDVFLASLAECRQRSIWSTLTVHEGVADDAATGPVMGRTHAFDHPVGKAACRARIGAPFFELTIERDLAAGNDAGAAASLAADACASEEALLVGHTASPAVAPQERRWILLSQWLDSTYRYSTNRRAILEWPCRQTPQHIWRTRGRSD